MRIDFEAHNDEVRAVWAAYRANKPIRVPMILGVNPRYTMFNHPANPRGTTYEQVWFDPQVMLERHLEHLEWCAFNLPQDAEMGLPEEWNVSVDFQNVYEAASLGCPIEYCEGQVPDTRPLLGPDDPPTLPKVPDPFTNPFWAKVWSFYDHMVKVCSEGFEWRGRPVRIGGLSGLGTDGPMTGACNYRGTMQFCADLIDEPRYADELLALLTEAIVVRIRAFRARLGLPATEQGFGYADDSVALLSTEMVLERIVPHHRRLVESFSTGGPNSIHLCGNATRHFPMLKAELNIKSFDTGFPVNFGELRRTLGDDVELIGGPSVPFLTSAPPEEVVLETKRVLESGVKKGGRFILREGNNLAPEVSVANVEAMYETVRAHGAVSEEP